MELVEYGVYIPNGLRNESYINRLLCRMYQVITINENQEDKFYQILMQRDDRPKPPIN
jgi:hypothetical protein